MNMTKWIPAALVVLATALLWFFGFQFEQVETVGQRFEEGEVTSIEEVEGGQLLMVNDIEVMHYVDDFVQSTPYEVGDNLVVTLYEDPLSGNETAVVNDEVRRPALIAAFGVFLVVVLFVAGWQGAMALLAMTFSFVVLLRLVLPLFLMGQAPALALLLGAILIVPVMFGLSHGWNKKSFVAMGSTLITLLVTSFLVISFTEMAGLTGMSSEEASFLQVDLGGLDFKAILLAGILLGLLGILDDVCVSQASVVQELKHLKKRQSFRELYTRSMRVGRDHIASLVNTMVLVYAGAALPLLLLFVNYDQPFTQILNLEFMAEEVLRILLASIGLILAVPITTVIAVLTLEGEKSKHRH